MSTYGKAIPINLFGESHGKGIGIIINNLPAGITFDFDKINNDLSKRRPKSNISTSRQEKDNFDIVSGYFDNHTTGTPLTILIKNEDTRSKDYQPNILRPSHADYTAHIKHNGYQDFRGGGHFSGRITAPIVILGSICSQILAQKGIIIGSHINSIKDITDLSFNDLEPTKEVLKNLLSSDFPILDSSKEEELKSVILSAKAQNNSVGGTIETIILGIPPGLGEPFFDSIESTLSHLLFSIPAVKGLEFGKGFKITELFGSEANDLFMMDNGSIKTMTNNSGGIQGGITNGMPIQFKVAIKPTASIGLEQKTVDLNTMKDITFKLKGRHDPCIVHRVVHVINAITAYGILETIVRKEGTTWIK